MHKIYLVNRGWSFYLAEGSSQTYTSYTYPEDPQTFFETQMAHVSSHPAECLTQHCFMLLPDLSHLSKCEPPKSLVECNKKDKAIWAWTQTQNADEEAFLGYLGFSEYALKMRGQ